MRVYCLPYAGAGAGIFRKNRPDSWLDVRPVQLPGREERYGERPPTAIADFAAGCAREIRGTLPATGGYALFGHSFGARLAFEMARKPELQDRPPSHLVLSGAAAPHTLGKPMGVAELDDDELVAALSSLVGFDHAALRNPALRRVLMPTLRADLTAQDAYRLSGAERVDVPITVLHGRRDCLVTAAEAKAWADLTTAGFELIELPGEHMWLTEDWPLLWSTLERALAGYRAAPYRVSR